MMKSKYLLAGILLLCIVCAALMFYPRGHDNFTWIEEKSDIRWTEFGSFESIDESLEFAISGTLILNSNTWDDLLPKFSLASNDDLKQLPPNSPYWLISEKVGDSYGQVYIYKYLSPDTNSFFLKPLDENKVYFAILHADAAGDLPR